MVGSRVVSVEGLVVMKIELTLRNNIENIIEF